MYFNGHPYEEYGYPRGYSCKLEDIHFNSIEYSIEYRYLHEYPYTLMDHYNIIDILMDIHTF